MDYYLGEAVMWEDTNGDAGSPGMQRFTRSLATLGVFPWYVYSKEFVMLSKQMVMTF